MNWTLQSLVGILMEAIIIGVLLRLNRNFGEYTEIGRRACESNRAVEQRQTVITGRQEALAGRIEHIVKALPSTPYTPHHDRKEIA